MILNVIQLSENIFDSFNHELLFFLKKFNVQFRENLHKIMHKLLETNFYYLNFMLKTFYRRKEKEILKMLYVLFF